MPNVMIPHMYHLVEELSVCHEGVNIEVLKGVMYAISISDVSTFLYSIEACRLMMDYIANIFLDIYLVNIIIIIVFNY